ncbi:hypothetical protein AGR9A_Cc100009 [Agrobacterium salinitolerans str. Hayward 0363]|nr:hypothetical protein AGR9A_Cc100009 [Agrobacterium salinitolerans str. Hayward 0363]
MRYGSVAPSSGPLDHLFPGREKKHWQRLDLSRCIQRAMRNQTGAFSFSPWKEARHAAEFL